MWLLFALGSAFFAGIMSVLSKIGIKNSDSDLVTAVRTFYVLIFCAAAVFISKAHLHISQIPNTTMAFLLLSGITTALSWLCYFRALSAGDVNSVAAIDKTTTVIAGVSAIILFHETQGLVSKIIGITVISVGIAVMSFAAFKEQKGNKKEWILFAFSSALFSALTAILSKLGVEEIDSVLATAIRTAMVLFVSFIIVLSKKKIKKVKDIPKKDMLFIFLSGIATALGWLSFYKALSLGDASLVVPVDKLGLLFTALFSCILLKEKISKKQWTGIGIITFGTLFMALVRI